MEIAWTDITQKILGFAETGLARDVLGHISQPAFYSIKEQHEKSKRGELNTSDENKSFFKKIIIFFKENVLIGDEYSIGAAAVILANHFFGGEGDSSIRKWINRIGWGVLVGGIVLSRVAKKAGLHLPYALGDEAASALLDDIKKATGADIIEKLDNKKLKESRKHLEKVLVYRESIAAELHKIAHQGGFIYGAPGVGKTAGVINYLGEWIETMESNGKTPEVHMLRLSEFTKGLEKVKAKQEQLAKDLSKLGGGALLSNFVENKAVTALKLLVAECEGIKKSVLDRNKQSGGEKVCAKIFIDDIDKACELAGLKGADRQSVNGLFGRLHDLIESPDKWQDSPLHLIITSNLTILEIRKKLETVLDANVLEPFLSRLGKSMVEVDRPDVGEQARMSANYLLRDYSNYIDYEELGVNKDAKGAVDKIDLAKAILAHSNIDLNKLGPIRMPGRFIEEAINGLNSRLKIKAKEILSSSISDVELSTLSAEEMVKRANVKIDSQTLHSVLQEYHSNYIKTLCPEESNSIDVTVRSIVKTFLADKKEQVTAFVKNSGESKPSIWKLLEAVYDKEEVTNAVIYKPKNDDKVILDNKESCKHIIVVDKSRKENTVYVKFDSHNRDDRVWLGNAYTINEFEDLLSKELAFASGGDLLTKFIEGIVRGLSNDKALGTAVELIARAATH